ncbi:MAG: cytochrome c [Proteobacteria bacterium]|nr:cytochrome c [Pseudomonadota bacterium]
MRPGHRKLLLGFLAACFFGQTALVYSDPTPTTPLSEEALGGARTWHANNCQSCHQIYGFGGFLGPDLTNVAARYPGTALDGWLTHVLAGTGQMPHFALDEGERAGLAAFLREVDTTGIGQARVGPGDSGGFAAGELPWWEYE